VLLYECTELGAGKMLEQLIEEACDLYDWIALLWAAFWRDSWRGMARQRQLLKQLCIVAERSEVAVFVLRHHTRMIANQVARSTPRDVRPQTQSTERTNGRDVRSIPNSSPKLSWR
jgi:hypothetical protein